MQPGPMARGLLEFDQRLPTAILKGLPQQQILGGIAGDRHFGGDEYRSARGQRIARCLLNALNIAGKIADRLIQLGTGNPDGHGKLGDES